MHKFGMSFLTGFGANPDNYYYTSADALSGNPPLSFGAVFGVYEHGSATEQAIWGNLNTTAAPDEGWLLKVAGQWQIIPSQIVRGVMGALTIDAGVAASGSATKLAGAAMQACFVTVCADGSGVGSNAYIYVNGNLVDVVSDQAGPTIGSDQVRLGFTPSDLALNPLSGYINTVFYENSCLSALQVRQLWQQLQHYGRLTETTDLDYIWQVYHNPNASASWVSRGAAATPKTLTRVGSSLTVEYWPRVSWAGIVPEAGLGVVDVTDIQTEAYDAAAGEAVLVNVSGGGFTVTFPADPAVGSQIRVVNVTSSLNTLTIDGGTINVEDPDLSIDAMGTTATLTGDGFSYDFMYTGVYWKVV